MQTEDVFREANERIAEKAHELELQQPIPFLCECSDKRCFAHLRSYARAVRGGANRSPALRDARGP